MKFGRKMLIAGVLGLAIILGLLWLILINSNSSPLAQNLASPTPVNDQSANTEGQILTQTAAIAVSPGNINSTQTPNNLGGNGQEASTLIPAVTVNPNLPAKLPSPTINLSTPTPNFGSLTTPPPTLIAGTPASISGTVGHNGFVVATSDGLYWLGADGKDQHIIIGGTRFSQPKVSPDGLHIAVIRTDPISRKDRLYLLNADGSQQTAIDNADNLLTLNASWSPDSKILALTRTSDVTGDLNSLYNDAPSIWLFNLVTQKLQQVAIGRDPVWSPDGVRIAYIIPGPFSAQTDPATHQPLLSANSIAIYNLQQEAKRTLTSADGLQFALKGSVTNSALAAQTVNLRYFKQLNWSPDSKQIGASADALTTDVKRVGLILTLSPDNPSPQLLTAGNQAAGRLSWSPNGQQLVFEGLPQFPVAPQSSYNIALVNLPSTNSPTTPASFMGDAVSRTEDSQPHWIMNGQALAFLEGDFNSLAITNNNGQDKHLLISDCLGFDWVA